MDSEAVRLLKYVGVLIGGLLVFIGLVFLGG